MGEQGQCYHGLSSPLGVQFFTVLTGVAQNCQAKHCQLESHGINIMAILTQIPMTGTVSVPNVIRERNKYTIVLLRKRAVNDQFFPICLFHPTAFMFCQALLLTHQNSAFGSIKEVNIFKNLQLAFLSRKKQRTLIPFPRLLRGHSYS